MARGLRRIALLMLLSFAAVGGYLVWVAGHPLHPGDRHYEVASGTGASTLARQLTRANVLKEPWSFMLLARLSGRANRLKAGEYRFRDNLHIHELLEQVVAGRVVEYPLTLVEGWTFRELRAAMQSAPRLDNTLTGYAATEVMASLGYPGSNPEGRFFPDTYHYSSGMSDVLLLRRAHADMERALMTAWENRASGLPYRSPDELLVMASVIEKETGLDAERRHIAAVFINRLRLGMRLQSDPTVIYGLGESFDGDLRVSDLRRRTPYNTYTIPGLPPTPICSPGLASLEAAAHPEDATDLYFVARGDGGHEFTSNLTDHNRAVARYQRARRSAQAASR